MGEYFEIVCHDCKRKHTPSLMKLGEIAINVSVAAEIGQFATLHPAHHLELVGDEAHDSRWAKTTNYTAEPRMDDDADIVSARERYELLLAGQQALAALGKVMAARERMA